MFQDNVCNIFFSTKGESFIVLSAINIGNDGMGHLKISVEKSLHVV